MIYPLKEQTTSNIDLVGKQIHSLSSLWKAQVEVVDTVVVTNQLFRSFMDKRYVEEQQVDQIIEAINKTKMLGSPHLFIQTSTKRKSVGLFDKVKIDNDYSSLKYAVEKIYRSWFEDRAQAYRMTHSTADEESFPAILIQPCHDNIYSLVTRVPKNGDRTNESNYEYIVHNKINQFKSDYANYLSIVEGILQAPSKIFFIDNDGPKICKVSEELMTDAAYWKVLDDFLAAGIIDSYQYLLSITPQMIAFPTGYGVVVDNDVFCITGISAAPGQVVGVLVFNDRDIDNFEPAYRKILATDYDDRGHSLIFSKYSGVIAPHMGQSDHLPVICRALGVPAVIGIGQISFDYKNRNMVCANKKIAELSEVILDGSEGKIYFTHKGHTINKYKIKEEVKPHIKKLVQLLSMPHVEFRQLPVTAQLHLAELKISLKKVGAIDG